MHIYKLFKHLEFIGNICDRSFQKTIVDGTIAKFGKLDILVKK